jgi:hypothetical protein
MLRVLGHAKRLCDGITRRDLLQVGALGTLGLTLEDALRSQAQAASNNRPGGKAKACILLFLYGSPSQLETFDPKPDAPEGIRGELGTIPTNVPGVRFGELLPQTSQVMDKITVVRSLTHPYPVHGVAYATTGIPVIDVGMELSPRDPRHWPFIGSVVSYLNEQRGRRRAVPDNIALPWPFSSRRTGEVQRAGPYAAFLGGAYHPHFTEFVGEATATMEKSLRDDKITFKEPYMGITPSSRFTMGDASVLPAELTIDRFARRRSLLDQLDTARRTFEASDANRAVDQHRQMAYSMISSDQVRTALDIQKEAPTVRDRYGMTLFGQSCLAARRLVEAGSRFVTVFWDEFGLAGSGWDTHWDHYNRMKQELCPGFDHGFAGLISDLHERGMLDDTMVVCLSEHGRTPKLSSARGGGRDHWARAYSAAFAGGGVARGRVIGSTDKIAGDVAERPISPKSVLATIYHQLGIDPETEVHDRANRPLPLVANGEILHDLMA